VKSKSCVEMSARYVDFLRARTHRTVRNERRNFRPIFGSPFLIPSSLSVVKHKNRDDVLAPFYFIDPRALSGVIVGDVPILRSGGSCRRGGGGRRGCRRRRWRWRCRTTWILVSAPILSHDSDTNASWWLSSGHARIHLWTVRRISTGAIYGVSFSRKFLLVGTGNFSTANS